MTVEGESKSSEKAEESAEETVFPVDEYFFTRDGIDALHFAFDSLNFDYPLKELGDVFLKNLVGAALTAMSFMVLARRVSFGVAYQSMVSFAVGFGRTVEEAQKKVHDFLGERGGVEKFGDSASQQGLKFLEKFLDDEMGRDIAIQSLNQCTVLVWSAFEVLASDVFVRLLNTKPKLANTLLRDERTKNSYRSKDIAESLEKYNYDLSGHMGEILLDQNRLDKLPGIKSVYQVILGSSSSELMAVLDRKEFWFLYKARNVIVHRASVVDEQFRRDTGIAMAIGSKFRVTAAEFEKFLIMVGEAGVALLKTTSALAS